MAILLGALASLLIGCADFLGRYGTRRSNAITAVNGALVGGVAITFAGLFVIDSAYGSRDVLLGVASGLVVGLALVTLYEAMATSSAAVAAPLVALGAGLIPLAWDFLLGNTPSGLVVVGVSVAVASLLLVTYSPELRGRLGRGVRFALASALLFGVALTFAGESADGSGVWTPFAQRVVALAVITAIATGRHVPLLPAARLLPIMIVSGMLGAGGVIAFTLGTQQGSLAAVAVAASMFPAVSSGLSAAFDEDTLRWWQMLGIAGVVGGISLMAVG